MAGKRKTLKDRSFERNIDDSFAGERVMSVIRHGLRSDVWRNDLMIAHFALVYHYAHHENDRIDFSVKHANWLKPTGIAARIIAAREPAEARTA